MATLNLNLAIDGAHYAVITVDADGYVDVPVSPERGPLGNRIRQVKRAAEQFAAWYRSTDDHDGVVGGTWEGGIEINLA